MWKRWIVLTGCKSLPINVLWQFLTGANILFVDFNIVIHTVVEKV